MQKLSLVIFLICYVFLSGCHTSENKSAEKMELPKISSIFPVTSYLKGQLLEIDSLPVTPLKIVTENGKSDSTWLKRPDIRTNAAPFLTPVIDSLTMSPLFSEKSFLDQTINAFTFSYDPKAKLPDSLHVRHWDVYINPQDTKVSRIYIVKENKENNIEYTTQLTWEANQWYSIRTIEETPGKPPMVKEMKMIWNF